jgi:hypothetical protein
MNSSTESESQINLLKQENEILLLQLHQVQEELERYFLLHRDRESKTHALQSASHSNSQTYKNIQLFVERLPKNLARILRQTPAVKKAILRNSNFFDEKWYLQTYPDVAEKRKDPVAHYLRHGAKEGRNPGPQFDTRWYLANYRDVAEKGVNPLLHYIQFGQHEGRQPSQGGIQPPPDPFVNERKWLTQARNEQARLATERQRRIEQLTHVINEAAKQQLKEQQETQEALSRLTHECEQKSRLQVEIQQLIQAREFQARLAEERLQQIELLTSARAETEQQAHEFQNRIAALIQAKDEQAQLAADRLQQIEELTIAKTEAGQQADELQHQIAALTQAKDEQAKLAADRLQQVEQLTVAKTEAEKQAGERQNQIAALTQAKDEQFRRESELQQRINQLEYQLADTETRQKLLNDEMIKAEAQIDLIKDILLVRMGV